MMMTVRTIRSPFRGLLSGARRHAVRATTSTPARRGGPRLWTRFVQQPVELVDPGCLGIEPGFEAVERRRVLGHRSAS